MGIELTEKTSDYASRHGSLKLFLAYREGDTHKKIKTFTEEKGHLLKVGKYRF